MQKIQVHIWFDKEGKEAAHFYTSVFKNSRIKSESVLDNTPSGSVDMVTLDIMGQAFSFISAGPYFKVNPSISFLVALSEKEEIDRLWNALSDGGTTLMELGPYPFSEHYGWIQDRYGVSWQLMHAKKHLIHQTITPAMMFVGNVCDKAEDAITFYRSVFHNTSIGDTWRYGPNERPDKEGTLKYASFTLEGQEFVAMDSAHAHKFAFNEAVSFIISCKDQTEIDYYWDKLSADPKAEQCGWLKDKYGVSWQVVPTVMDEMLKHGDKKKIARVTEAFLKMKKFDLAELERIYRQT